MVCRDSTPPYPYGGHRAQYVPPRDRQTPLFRACQRGNLDVVNLLLLGGGESATADDGEPFADVNHQDSDGTTAAIYIFSNSRILFRF